MTDIDIESLTFQKLIFSLRRLKVRRVSSSSPTSEEGVEKIGEPDRDPSSSSSSSPANLTDEQKERIARNKEIAREKRRQRDAEEEEHHRIVQEEGGDTGDGDRRWGGFYHEDKDKPPDPKKPRKEDSALIADMKDVYSEGTMVRIQGTKVIDSGGGFLIEEKDLMEQEDEERVLNVHPAAIVPTDTPNCIECGMAFVDSYLLHNFDHPVCDNCKDMEEKHKLITKTDAKNQYLLKDVDLDKREPILRFISRPNPHNNRWGDMKLFLRLQVEKRAIEVWDSLEKIEEQIELREENRAKTKIKKYNKKMGVLRMAARSSLYTRNLGPHEHTWGPDECIDEEEDTYKHKCTECGQEETFEKM